MEQFEVWIINFDPSVGAEITKTRPAVILSPAVMNKNLATVIVAPLTSIVRGYPTRLLTDFESNGGEIALDQLRTVDKIRLVKKIGIIDPEEAKAICQILKTMFSYE